MKISEHAPQLTLPPAFRRQLAKFRQRVWAFKMLAAGCAAGVALGASFLIVFAVDRVWDTPGWLRALLLVLAAITAMVLLPVAYYRWVWGSRRLRDVARIVSHIHPRMGDRLLGIVELVEAKSSQQASPALCRAAIEQVANESVTHGCWKRIPHPTHRRWAWSLAAVSAMGACALAVPGAGINAWQRWTLPWRSIPRFTFVQLTESPRVLYVPTGERFHVSATLTESSRWSPTKGIGSYGDQSPVRANLDAGQYVFDLPPQTESQLFRMRVGDAIRTVPVEPAARPELLEVAAEVHLPPYLQLPSLTVDARAGSVSAVEGSHVVIRAQATRRLSQASLDSDVHMVALEGGQIVSVPLEVSGQEGARGDETHELHWRDELGLSAKSPFLLHVKSVPDEPPVVMCRELVHEQVILQTEVLSFQVGVSDDFGIRRVGVEWSGVAESKRNPHPPAGEYPLQLGAPDAEQLDVRGTFSAEQLRVEPQPIDVRVYAEDYLPARGRVYSPTYRLHVLDAEEHLIWLTRRLQRWERQVQEVRDEEQRLYEENAAFSQMSPEELSQPENRRRLADQAEAERANGRQLQGLTAAGTDLIQLATRNPEFDAITLENWAQILKALQSLSQHRMPSVANLLMAASAAAGAPSDAPQVPSIADVEMGMREDQADFDSDGGNDPPPPAAGSGGQLGLPTTTLSSSSRAAAEPGADTHDAVQVAVDEQAALLDEFNQVMDELAQILQQLQGSTFVKRLKQIGRLESSLAAGLHDHLKGAFGQASRDLSESARSQLLVLQATQTDAARDLRLIEADLLAYFHRTQQLKFQQVHDEMRGTEAVVHFQEMVTAVAENLSGETIAEAEYWTDQLDRWAEILVGPGADNGGMAPGAKGDNLPPALILEVLRMLQSEMGLRDLTRVAEQSRKAVPLTEYLATVHDLVGTQGDLQRRITSVIDAVETMQREEQRDFENDLRRLYEARAAMIDAVEILGKPDTGGQAIAAETAVIEALMEARRGGGGGGGGGGTVPGGGSGGGETDEEASALAGLGDDERVDSRNVEQSLGADNDQFPPEYRDGLDAYFNALENSYD